MTPKGSTSNQNTYVSRHVRQFAITSDCCSCFSSEPTILLSVSGDTNSGLFVLCVGDEKTRTPAKANPNGI